MIAAGNSNTNSKFKQKFKQQRLPAWQPILTADTVLPAFFLIGFLFIPLGIALLYFSNNVDEYQLDYTNCTSTNQRSRTCQDIIAENMSTPCLCEIPLNIDKPFKKNVYVYYGLDNFYQNHRRYVKSRDDRQLNGASGLKSVSTDCAPFDVDDKGRIYAPCGAISNSMFNDTIRLFDWSTSSEVDLLKNDIAWPTDKSRKFNNPEGALNGEEAFANTVKPMYWTKNVWELDTSNADNNGYENEDLIVWMRTAAFPSFRKLYRRVNHEKEGLKHSLPAGNYTVLINYTYPVKSFGGRKRVILSTTSFLGGKNNFLGIAYITVGSVCILLGIIFLIIHIKFGKRPNDLLNITPNTPYSE